MRLICVNRLGSVPPVEADLRTTATLTTTGNGNRNLKVNDNWYVYGVNFIAGSGATDGTQIRIANGYNCSQVFENCSFYQASTGSAQFSPGETGQNVAKLINCTIKFGSISQGFLTDRSRFTMFGGSIAATGSVPTTLIHNDDGLAYYKFFGVDMSNITRIFDNPQNTREMYLTSCKIASNLVWVNNYDRAPGMIRISAKNCNSSGSNVDYYYNDGAGTLVHDPLVYAAATDGTSGFSARISTFAVATPSIPLEMPPWAPFNAVTGANRTITIEGFCVGALPTNEEIWFEAEYEGSSTSPIPSWASQGRAKITAAANQTASTKSWTAPARVSSAVKALNDVISVASNTGRVFVCTTAGTLAGSEPAGYAGAVDGGTVADGGSAVFTAATRFKMALTLSAPQPADVGPIIIRVMCGKSSGKFWIDPKATIA